MATTATRVTNLATRIATEVKSLRVLINGNAADLLGLTTTAKGNLVLALNELKAELVAIGTPVTINDASTASTTQTWSITKIGDAIAVAIAVLTTGAPVAMNTLDELSAALGDDANFAATITTALGNRLRVDTGAQGLTAPQQANARANIDAYGSVEIGNPDTDFVTTFNTGLV